MRNAGIGSPRGAYHPTLRRSRHARHNTAVLHLHRCLQPALNVEQHPRTVRMLTDRLEHQLPIDAIEEALDVEIKHPVVAPQRSRAVRTASIADLPGR